MDSLKQVESLENQSTKRIHETNLLKTLRIRDPRYETNLFGVRIHDYDTKRIHVFTNLLYDSRILTKNPFQNIVVNYIRNNVVGIKEK